MDSLGNDSKDTYRVSFDRMCLQQKYSAITDEIMLQTLFFQTVDFRMTPHNFAAYFVCFNESGDLDIIGIKTDCSILELVIASKGPINMQ